LLEVLLLSESNRHGTGRQYGGDHHRDTRESMNLSSAPVPPEADEFDLAALETTGDGDEVNRYDW
jgi:hypothetical protein